MEYRSAGTGGTLWRISPEPHSARSGQRYPCDELEVRYVPVPSELRSGRILCNQRVCEIVCGTAGPCGRFRPQGVQERSDRFTRLQPLAGKVVSAAVADDAPVGQKAFVFRLLQREALECRFATVVCDHGDRGSEERRGSGLHQQSALPHRSSIAARCDVVPRRHSGQQLICRYSGIQCR